MAQQLWLLRHGEAEPHDARPDAERRLTDRGREQARAAGCALAALKVQVHLAFTSPKVRARDTARAGLRGARRGAGRPRRAVRRLRRRRRAASSSARRVPISACSWSATSPTSPRSSTTSPARASTSRRAASRRCGSTAPRRARRAAAPARARADLRGGVVARGPSSPPAPPPGPGRRRPSTAARRKGRELESSTAMPVQMHAARTSMRLAAPSTPTIWPPSSRPSGATTSLTQIGPLPGSSPRACGP